MKMTYLLLKISKQLLPGTSPLQLDNNHQNLQILFKIVLKLS